MKLVHPRNSLSSLPLRGVEEFRRDQGDIVGRISHNAAGAVLTSYGKEVAMVLPFEYSKMALTLVHLVENARVHSATDEADRNPDQTFYDLEYLITEREASEERWKDVTTSRRVIVGATARAVWTGLSQASPAPTSILVTVLIETPTVRLIERMGMPSTNMFRITKRLAVGNLFMPLTRVPEINLPRISSV